MNSLKAFCQMNRYHYYSSSANPLETDDSHWSSAKCSPVSKQHDPKTSPWAFTCNLLQAMQYHPCFWQSLKFKKGAGWKCLWRGASLCGDCLEGSRLGSSHRTCCYSWSCFKHWLAKRSAGSKVASRCWTLSLFEMKNVRSPSYYYLNLNISSQLDY